MSTRFASITADLLARKGEARPWSQDPLPASGNPPPAWQAGAPPLVARAASIAPAPMQPSPPAERSCHLRMSVHDYERLGIIAVKAGSTRQQLLKEALAQYLASQAAHYSCACLGACNNGCGAGN